MSDQLDISIARQMRRVTGAPDGTHFPIMTGVVKAVDAEAASCDVELTVSNGVTTEGVMLNALLNITEGVLLLPAVNSKVWVAEVDGPGKYGVIKCSLLTNATVTVGNAKVSVQNDEVRMEAGGTAMVLNPSLFSMVSGGGEDVYGLLTDLLNAIRALTVSTGTGPSSVPVNVADFVALQTRLDNLFG